jgi:hypothetical protein
MANTSPSEAINTGLTIVRDTTRVLHSQNLLYSDAEQPDSQIVYTISHLPTAGVLKLAGVAMSVGTIFTQASIDAGLLSYEAITTGSANGTFGFFVTDGAGGYVGGKTFAINITPDSAPVGAVNTGLTVLRGTAVRIESFNLLYGDAEQPDSQIVYTIDTLPAAGALRLNGVALTIGGHFNQVDLDVGRVSYVHQPSGPTSASFGFSVSDGLNVVTGKTFSFTAGDSNTSPFETVNNGLTTTGGAISTLTTAHLSYADAQQADTQIYYTITANVGAGVLNRAGMTLGAGDRFTQADLAAGLISYRAGSESADVSTQFQFQVTDGVTGYVGGKTFAISYTPNISPRETVNEGAAIRPNETITISNAALIYVDPDQSESQIIFTVTSAPVGGTLLRDGVPLALGGTFTQADLQSNLVTYRAGAETGNGTFGFQVTDGAGGYVGGKTFRIDIAINQARTVDTATLSSGDGAIIPGQSASAQIGSIMAVLGDINGDGHQDFAFKVGTGRIAVVYGTDAGFGSNINGQQVLNYNSMTPQQGFIVTGSDTVSGVGDINGDGLAEMVFGRPTGGIQNQGDAYVIFGRSSGFGTVVDGHATLDIRTITIADGFLARGKEGGDTSGAAVAGAGDVNGDGFADLLVGGPQADPNGHSTGNAYVMFGHSGSYGVLITENVSGVPTQHRVVYLGGLNPGEGVLVAGNTESPYAGQSVSPLGDVNGDGLADFVVESSAKSAVIFGTAGSFGPTIAGQTTINFNDLPPSHGFLLNGVQVHDAGDVNGDGFADIISGNALIYGSGAAIGDLVDGQRVLDPTALPVAAGFTATGAIFGIGDVNGDGRDDLLVGRTVVYGKAEDYGTPDGNGRLVFDPATILPGEGYFINEPSTGVVTGEALGDVNGDGLDDFLFGSPSTAGNMGAVYVLFGKLDAAAIASDMASSAVNVPIDLFRDHHFISAHEFVM